MNWIFLSAIIGLSLIIYFTVKFEGFQSNSGMPNPPKRTLVKRILGWSTDILEKYKDNTSENILKLKNHADRLRSAVITYEGEDLNIVNEEDRTTPVYSITMLDLYNIHLLIEDIQKSK
jgi:hypothetical protein